MHEDYAGEKLCIFISKNDKYEGIVLYELLLEIAFNSRLSGGTVTMGDKGFFGAQDESTGLKILRSSENVPVVLEFQGRPNRIDRYVDRIQPMIKEGLLTRADVWITKISSPGEDTADLQEQENSDQSQIFNEDTERVDIPDPHSPSQEFQVGGDQDETISPDLESAVDQKSESELLEPDQDQMTEEDEIPLFDDDDSSPNPEPLATDQENLGEDDVKEVPDPQVEDDSFIGAEGDEDDPDIPSFQSVDDNPVPNDTPKFEDEDEDEDAPVLQLADLSETQSEESPEDPFEMDDPDEIDEIDETAEDASSGTEFAEPQTDEDIDKLFDESNEKFENTFDDMLKEVGGATVDQTNQKSAGKTTSDKEQAASPGNEEDDSAGEDSKTYDKNHTEEDMKNYFSELFKK